MAFWNPGQIISINDGARPNDGTGDDIRDAFIKVNNNFGNISSQLSQFNQIPQLSTGSIFDIDQPCLLFLTVA